jgi:glutamate synthase (NADPH/NADH) small chain
MIKEGLTVRTGIRIGQDISAKEIVSQFDAVCIAIGSGEPRDLNVEGRELGGIHFAMDFLINQNRVNSGRLQSAEKQINAENKKVLVIGGGDTGSDCVGTAIRQKAASVIQVEILPKPPLERTPENPWPYFSKTLKTSTSHEEGCERLWSLSTLRFTGTDGVVKGVEIEEVKWEVENGRYTMKPVQGTRRIIEADFILLALGFIHPVVDGLVSELELELDGRKNIKANDSLSTNIQKVFAAGDSVTGASLIVNAIASGRKAAKEIDRFLKSL